MVFVPKRPSKEKVQASYKTIYLNDDVIAKLEEMAKEYDLSFNAVVVSMILYCLELDEGEN